MPDRADELFPDEPAATAVAEPPSSGQDRAYQYFPDPPAATAAPSEPQDKAYQFFPDEPKKPNPNPATTAAVAETVRDLSIPSVERMPTFSAKEAEGSIFSNNQPLVNLPPLEAQPNDTTRQHFEKAAGNVLRGFISGATTPEGFAGLILPPYGVAQMIAAVPEQWGRVKKAEQTPPWSQERFEAGLGLATTIATLGLAAKGAAKLTEKPTARPNEPSATLIPPEAQTSLREPTQVQERPSGEPLLSETQRVGGEVNAQEPNTATGEVPIEQGKSAVPETESQVQAGTAREASPQEVTQPEQPIGGGLTEKEVQGQTGRGETLLAEPKAEGGDTTPATAAVVEPTAAEPLVSDEPHVSSIANRFVEERAARGEVGEVVPGQGASTADLVQQGLKMGPEEVSQHVSDLMSDTGDIVKQGQAIRAEEARLSQRSRQASRAAEASPTVENKLAADNAFKDLTDFHNGPVAKLKNKWHAAGMEMQGEIPVDLGTFNGLREAWLRDTGKAPPPKVEPILRETAAKVSKAVTEENGVRSRLAQEIDNATSRRKLPSVDEVRNNIRERLGLGPCKI